jgi:23S rRNA pseudouridine1911/1915/1917 synthase
LIPRQALHAYKIVVPHPDGGVLAFEAPLPEDLKDALSRLKED